MIGCHSRSQYNTDQFVEMSTVGVILEVTSLMLLTAWTVTGIIYLTYNIELCGPRSLLWEYALTWIFIPSFVMLCYLVDYFVWKDTGSKVRFFAFRNNWYPILIAIVTLGAYIFGQIVIYPMIQLVHHTHANL